MVSGDDLERLRHVNELLKRALERFKSFERQNWQTGQLDRTAIHTSPVRLFHRLLSDLP